VSRSPASPRRRTTAAPVAALAALLVFAGLAYGVHRGATQRLDVLIYHHFQAHPSAWVHTVMTGVTFLGSGAALTIWAVLCVVAWILRPDWRLRAVSLLLAVGGGEGVVNGLKTLFPRPRPSPLWAHLGSSFPSGHALFAVAVAAYGRLRALGLKTASLTTRAFTPSHPNGATTMKSLRIIAGVFAVLLLAVAFSAYSIRTARSSDHQDSPTVVSNPMEDITDAYVFPAPENPNNVVFVMDFCPLIPVGCNSNFDPNVLYQLKLANVPGDTHEHLVIQMKANGGGPSPTFSLYGPAAPNEVGGSSTPVVDGLVSPAGTFNFNAPTTLGNGIQVFVGPRHDPVFVGLPVSSHFQLPAPPGFQILSGRQLL